MGASTRLRCAELGRVGTPLPAGGAFLRGRVLTATVDGRVTLADESGAALLALEGECPAPGDIIRVDLVDGDAPPRGRWRRLTRYRRSVPFPSPDGEYARLHGGDHPRVAALRLRAAVLRAIRTFFDERGYLEVQTPRRVLVPGLEPHLVPVPVAGGHLITSPEYQMKRLLAGGLERIYSLGSCWRAEERGRHHLPEFCMLEWYRAGATLEQLMEETEELLRTVARLALGALLVPRPRQKIDLARRFARLTVAEACSRFAGAELRGVVDVAQLRAALAPTGLGPWAPTAGFDEIFSELLVARVEPQLARLPAVFLHDFPAPLAALARVRPDDPAVAERFELYVDGVELANAFGELTDPEEQLARLEADRRTRAARGAPAFAVDERFIEALREGIPPSAGIALGVDRLVMLLAGIDDVNLTVAFGPDEL